MYCWRLDPANSSTNLLASDLWLSGNSPHLIGWATTSEYQHCIWKKQPETVEEMEQALAAFDASEIGCYRYAGGDPVIMERIGRDFCDHPPSVPVEVSSQSSPEFRPTLLGNDYPILAIGS